MRCTLHFLNNECAIILTCPPGCHFLYIFASKVSVTNKGKVPNFFGQSVINITSTIVVELLQCTLYSRIKYSTVMKRTQRVPTPLSTGLPRTVEHEAITCATRRRTYITEQARALHSCFPQRVPDLNSGLTLRMHHFLNVVHRIDNRGH